MNYALPESDVTRTYVSAAVLEEEGNEIEITYPDSNRDSRNFANARQREKGRERSGRRGNYLCVRPPYMRFRSKVIAGFRVACSRATWMGEFERFARNTAAE